MSERTARPLRLGGMALQNGLLVHGPTSWAAAARAPGGTIEVASGPKPTFPGPAPRCRSCAGRCASPRASRSSRSPAGSLPVGAAPVRGPAGARVPRSPRPSPSAALRRGRGAGRAARDARGRPRPDARARRPARLATSPPTTASSTRRSAPTSAAVDPREVAKEHERCGSHLVAPMLAFSLAGQLVVERLVEKPGPDRPRRRGARRRLRRGRALRLVRAQSAITARPRLPPAGTEIQRAVRHPRADRRAARGRRARRSTRSFGPRE